MASGIMKRERIFLKKIYWNQVHNSRRYNRPDPSYSFEEFVEQFEKDEVFQAHFKKWLDTNSKWDRPSFDRIDESKPYSMDNIQVMSWRENFERANGVLRSVKIMKGGEVIKRFDCYNQAAKYLGVKRTSLREACMKGYNCKGHKVLFDN